MTFGSVSTVIFDMDGVIIDSEPIHNEAEQQVLARYNVAVSLQELQGYTGTTAEYMYRALIEKYRLHATWEDLFKEKEFLFFNLLKGHVEPIVGVIPLIHNLKQQGMKLALATSSQRRLVNVVLDTLGLTNTFDVIVASEDVTRSKPDPEIFLTAAKRLSVNPRECVVIEDSRYGVEAAQAAHMRCVGYSNLHSGNQDLSRANMIIDDFTTCTIQDLLSDE